MKLSDNKLQKLNSLQDQGGFWYITKQNLVFRDLCFMAKILESWNDDRTQSYEVFFNANKTKPEFGSFDALVAHRATKNCEYLGLLYTPDNGKYSASNLTPFYYALKKLCNGDFNRLSMYPKLVDKQLERMFVDSSSNVVYNVSFKINPFMFLFKILLLIGDITKAYQISIQEFKLFVATSQSWNDYFEVVESILRYRSDKEYQKQCDTNKAKVADVRMNILAQNHSQLEIGGSDITIKDGFVKEVRKKVAEYELSDKVESTDDVNNADIVFGKALQQIYYGAPGTGKSYEVKIKTGELDAAGKEYNRPNVFRTTFHPDTDYATFVGCYKPTMKPVPSEYRAVAGKEEDIVYEFVPQAFTDAYIYAYKNPAENTFLVIEEINRGNCAQIFGDLFQLLDRNGEGISEYTIKADKDLAKYLTKELGADSDGIKEGKLRLPANLHILATMNTSDQSLFPMDSAFKRRWDWQYVAISYSEPKSSTFKINVGEGYSWVDFIEQVNKRIFDLTQSEDKEMGNFFIKDSIDAEQFKSKVMFYLWFEVLRDEVENSKYFFYYTTQDESGKETNHKFTFKDLYGEKAETILEGFLKYITKGAE